MKKHLTTFVVFSLIWVGLFGSISTINAANKKLDLWVPVYGQEKENWCWNGSTQMVGHYLYKYKSQTDISKSTYGNTNDIPRLSATVVKAVNYATGYGHNYIVEYGGHLGYWRYAKSIDNGKPFLLGLKYSGAIGGHMVVGRGYEWDTSKNLYFLHINDPSPLNRGLHRNVNYAKFTSTTEEGYKNLSIFDSIVSKGKY